MLVVIQVHYAIFVHIHLHKQLSQPILIYLYLTSSQATPVGDEFRDDFLEFIEVKVACIVDIQEGKTELMLLILISIHKSVHNGGELSEGNKIVFVLVDYTEYSIRQEGI